MVHVEAGLRTLTPKRDILAQTLEEDFDVQKYFSELWQKENWEKGSIEPYPEQYNTRTAEPATGVHLAGTELHREFMLSEGFRDERIFVVGNSVVDAMAQVREQAKSSQIFEKYSQLKKGFIRFCIHRRENCTDEKRFVTIFEAMEKLVESGETVLLISLNATETALDNFNLQDRLEALKKFENFIYSPVWPYYQDVIAAMEKCTVCATDSGSMQEEMNEMRVPCVTLRYGTDRPESVFAGGNVIAPPISSDSILKIILAAKDLPP